MDSSILKSVGQIAGIGGIGIGVLLLVFRQLIAKTIFASLTKEQSYSLLRLMIVFTWSIAVLGIFAWIYANREHLAKDKPFTQQVRELAVEGSKVSVKPGVNGKVTNFEFHAKAEIQLSPLPSELKIEMYGDQGFWWRIIGANYSQENGRIFLFFERMPNAYSMAQSTRIIVHADGYIASAFNVDLSGTDSTRIILERQPPVALERVSRLESTGESVSYDIILSNATASPSWVKKISLVGLGTTNSVCNPNPIATFEYQAALKVVGEEAKATIKQASDKIGMQAKGRLMHAYCDGYFVLSYLQTVKLAPRDKLSYILTIQELDMSLAGGKSSSNDDTKPVARLGLSVSDVKSMFSEKPRKFSPKDFLIETGPSYYGPSWSSLQIVVELDTGELLFGKIMQGSWPTDYKEDAKKALISIGMTDRQAVEVISSAYQ